MKMLRRTGPVVEPVFKEISAPVTNDGRIVTRSVQITVEREVLSVLLHRPGVSFAGYCPQCAHDVMLLTVETAALLECVTPRSIYRWVESATVHFHETSEGAVFICSDSLKSQGRDPKKLEAREEP
jgi:hypothetical protein